MMTHTGPSPPPPTPVSYLMPHSLITTFSFPEQAPSQPPLCSHLMRLWILHNAAIVEGLCPVSLKDTHRDSDLLAPEQQGLFPLSFFPSPITPGTHLHSRQGYCLQQG